MNGHYSTPIGAYEAYMAQQQYQAIQELEVQSSRPKGFGRPHGLAQTGHAFAPTGQAYDGSVGYGHSQAYVTDSYPMTSGQAGHYSGLAENHHAVDRELAIYPAQATQYLYPSHATSFVQDNSTSMYNKLPSAGVPAWPAAGLLPPPQINSLQPAFEQGRLAGWEAFNLLPQPHTIEGRQQLAFWQSNNQNCFAEAYPKVEPNQYQQVSGRFEDQFPAVDSFPRPGYAQVGEVADASYAEAQQAPATAIEEPQLIAHDASAIPPPLPIEKSAHPLAALATDLVWEAFLSAANSNSPTSSSPSHFTSSDRSPTSAGSRTEGNSPSTRFGTRSSASPSINVHKRTSSKFSSPFMRGVDRSRSASAGLEAENVSANLYGAIGGERKPRLSLESSPGSDASSPASTAPGTPAMDTWMMAASGHADLGRFGGHVYWNEDEHTAVDHVIGKHTLPPFSSLLRPIVQQRFGGVTPPASLFDQIQKLLSATLLSQQVLILALYYVGKVPHTSPLYPPATSQSALQSTSAPFKLLLAALVVANKHLDDNSFRNSTFAQVANVSLPEVNALEYSLLAGLAFDLNVDSPAWLAWLQDLQTHSPTSFTRSQVSSSSIVSAIIEGVLVQQEQQAIAKEQGLHAVSLSAVLCRGRSVRHQSRRRKASSADLNFVPTTPRSESSFSGGFDLDAAGPIEQRPRYNKQLVLPPVHQYLGFQPQVAYEGRDPYAVGYGSFKGGFEYPGRMMMMA